MTLRQTGIQACVRTTKLKACDFATKHRIKSRLFCHIFGILVVEHAQGYAFG